jgi:hypothetical protein
MSPAVKSLLAAMASIAVSPAFIAVMEYCVRLIGSMVALLIGAVRAAGNLAMRDFDGAGKAIDQAGDSVFGKNGFFGDNAFKPYAPGATVGDVATWAEFGIGQPERSFLRAWFDANQARCKTALSRLAKSVLDGKRTKEQALETFGLWAQGEIQKRIAEGIDPANAASTVAKKGSSTPLVSTGQLRSSITFKVE